MNDHPLDQLDAHVPGKESVNTAPPLRKRDRFLDFLSLPKSLSKIKAKRSTQSLKSQALSEQSTYSSATSQVHSQQATPLLMASGENRPLKDIFPENVTKPAVKTALPGLQERIERTEQLLYCNMLLPQDSVVSSSFDAGEEKVTDDPANTPLEPTLDEGEQKWLEEIKEDPMRQDRMKWLVMKMVEAFVAETTKDSTKIAEIVALGPVMERELYRKLLSSFILAFENSRILDINLLQGLVQLVQSTSTGFLVSDDLVKVLSLLRTHLESTHQQSSEHLYHLTLAVSRILDVIADHKVQDLDRVLEHEPLSAVLSGLNDSSDPYLMYQACYAFQALQYVPDDETVLQAVLRLSTGVVDGVVKVANVLKLDLGSVLEGLEKLREVAASAIKIAGTVHEGVSSLMESGRGVLESMKGGFGLGRKKPWYIAVRAAYAFVQAGQLKDLKELIYEAPCRRDPLFQWGICQLLGEIAVDNVWAVAVRQQAIDLLGHLYKEDQEWGRDESVKTWMQTILCTLGSSSDGAINKYTLNLLQELDSGNSPKTQHSYPLRYCLPIPESSPVLTKVQGIPYLEYELYNLRMQRLKDACLPVYISHMAKPNLQAQDNEVFPLMDKVQDFLASDRQVMLILGDSGAGKSTFNKQLEHRLWTAYKRGGPIPLFINLPVLERPAKDLMGEQLREHSFSQEQIQELKQHRQFIVICDGYDESQLTCNIHDSNSLNSPGQWNVKLVISCRSQYLGQDYRDRFVPSRGSHYKRPGVDLFQEAVIAPFSTEQIKDYVEQYNSLEPRTWRLQDYMDKLTKIPNLMDLVKNPFLLSLALEALPGVVEDKQDLSTIRITRAQLYDTFVEHWSNVNKRRLQRNALSTADRIVFDELLDMGFVSKSIDYCTRLALAIFEEQDGNPIIQYVHDKNSWKAQFFGQDAEVRLLRDSSPLIRTGNLHRFLHRSMLEYFLSRTVFDPSKRQDHNGTPQQTDPAFSDDQPIDIHGPLFTRNLLTEPSVIQFLSDRVKESSSTWFKRHLLAVIELSKSDAQASQAAANAITILIRAGVHFNGADLRGIRIPGADLTGGQFDSARLQDADLTGVALAKAWIRQADLSRACMDGTQFGELPYLEESEEVSSCAFLSNGKYLAAGLDNGDINIYDTATWTKIHVLNGHRLRVGSLVNSPNSQQLLSGSNDKTARLWNCETASTDLILYGHLGKVTAVAFSPTGQQVATASYDKSVRLWDSQTGAAVFILADNINKVISIAYSPNGNTIASTGSDETIRIFDTLTGLPVLVSCEGGNRIMCLAYSLDGQRIATGSYGGQLQQWEVTAPTLEPGRTWTAHIHTITSLTFSPDDRWIASCSLDCTVKLWDSHSGLLISSFLSHVNHVNCVRFSPNGPYIASASDDKTLRLWEVNSSNLGIDSYELLDPQLCATYSPDGQQLITGSQRRPMRQLNVDSGDVNFVFPDHLHDTNCIRFSPDGLQLAIGSSIESEVTLWSVESRAASFVFRGHQSGVYSVAFTPCGRWLASGGKDGTVRLWDTRSGAAGHILIGHKRIVQSVAFSPDGCWIASVCMDGKIQLCEVDTGKRKADRAIDIGFYKWSVVVYNPGCLQVASSHGDGTIRLWDDDQQLQGFRYIVKQDQYSYKFAFSSCCQWVAAAHRTSVRLWRLPSSDQGQSTLPLQDQDCVSVIEGFTRAVVDVVWRPDKLEFVTSCWDGSIRAWRVVEDSIESGKVSVRLLWSSGHALLSASSALIHDAVGLSTMNRKLLELRGAIGSSIN